MASPRLHKLHLQMVCGMGLVLRILIQEQIRDHNLKEFYLEHILNNSRIYLKEHRPFEDYNNELNDEQNIHIVSNCSIQHQRNSSVYWIKRSDMPGGKIPSFPANLMLLKGCAVSGVFIGRFQKEEPAVHIKNLKTIGSLLAEGKINPFISKTVPMKDAVSSIQDIAQRKVLGKIVFTN